MEVQQQYGSGKVQLCTQQCSPAGSDLPSKEQSSWRARLLVHTQAPTLSLLFSSLLSISCKILLSAYSNSPLSLLRLHLHSRYHDCTVQHEQAFSNVHFAQGAGQLGHSARRLAAQA